MAGDTPIPDAKRPYRYPGVTPFSTEQSAVFFGRRQDTDKLYRFIRRQPLVVLYGKSGLGKSSLLNAGIIPRCRQENEYMPLVVRFYSWVEGKAISPLAATKAALAGNYPPNPLLDRLLTDDDSLWRHAKTRQLAEPALRPLLLFDQFEELFSYPEEEIAAFQSDLAELLHTAVPLRFRRLAEADAALTGAEEDLLEAPLDTRVVFAIRSDRMHLLDRLKDHLPWVLRHTFELKALLPQDAADAIVEPARAEGDFVTPPFAYTPAALTALLTYLADERDDEGRVEGILLQMLCEHYERKVVEDQGVLQLDREHIGDPKQVVSQYYADKWRQLAKEQQLPARRLIEEGLVTKGEGEAMRLSLHESYIRQEFGVPGTLLERLVDSRLLRAEPFLRGGYTYELSHDRLVPPVLEARAERQAEEARLEALHRESTRIAQVEAAFRQMEMERHLREQAQAGERLAQQRTKLARQRTRLAVWISVIALALAALAGWLYLDADRAKQDALSAKQAAERDRIVADSLKNVAITSQRATETALKEADSLKNVAIASQAATEAALVQARESDRLAQEQRRLAEQSAREANENLRRIQEAEIAQLLNEAQVFERAGEYPSAIARLREVLRRDPDNREAKARLAVLERRE